MVGKLTLGWVVAWLAVGALAQDRARPRAPERARGANTLRILNQQIPEVRFEETPFEQVVEWLGEFTGLNISVRWQTLNDAGVERTSPVSIQARNLRLSQVLWLIMNAVAGPDLRLAYRASGNLLVLSTAEDLNKEMVTRVYDVSDLLIRIPQAMRSTGFDVSQGLGQGGTGGGGGAGGMFGQGQQQQQQMQQQGVGQQAGQEQIDKLIELIEETVEPDSWRRNGAGNGTIMAFQNRFLVVHNTLLVHQRLGGFVSEEEIGGK